MCVLPVDLSHSTPASCEAVSRRQWEATEENVWCEESGKIRWQTDLAAQMYQHSHCRCLIRVNWDIQSDLGHLHFPFYSCLLLFSNSLFILETASPPRPHPLPSFMHKLYNWLVGRLITIITKRDFFLFFFYCYY